MTLLISQIWPQESRDNMLLLISAGSYVNNFIDSLKKVSKIDVIGDSKCKLHSAMFSDKKRWGGCVALQMMTKQS